MYIGLNSLVDHRVNAISRVVYTRCPCDERGTSVRIKNETKIQNGISRRFSQVGKALLLLDPSSVSLRPSIVSSISRRILGHFRHSRHYPQHPCGRQNSLLTKDTLCPELGR